MSEIIRGTTPTLIYRFNDIDPDDIVYAYLLMKQNGGATIEKYLADATVEPDTQEEKGYISFTLTQAETLLFHTGASVSVTMDWKLESGVRGRSARALFDVGNSGKDEVV